MRPTFINLPDKKTINNKQIYRNLINGGLYTKNGNRVYYNDIMHVYTTSVNFANTRNTPELLRERREGAARARERLRMWQMATTINELLGERPTLLRRKPNRTLPHRRARRN
jgi:hypothetical protein